MSDFIIDWQNLLKYRRYAFVFSALLVFLGLAAIGWNGGLLYGIDFTGGIQMMFEFSRPVTTSEVGEVRELFRDRLEAVEINTFDPSSQARRQGIMVTVRGRQLVENLTDELAASGAEGQEKFERLANHYLIDRATLAENFRFGEGPPEKLNLLEVQRSDIRNRVQTIVNETVTRQVIGVLRDRFTPDNTRDEVNWDNPPEQVKIDVNWASPAELRQWLVETQLDGFVREFAELREEGGIEDLDQLADLFERFDVPRPEFQDIFTTQPDQPELNLNEIEIDGFKQILAEEFFSGRYEPVAEEIVEIRNRRNLFKNSDEFLELEVVQGLYEPTLSETAGFSPFVLLSSDMVSPAVGGDLITLALMAILISFGGVLAYLYVRFELTYSLAAISAIVHDVLLTVGLLTLLGVEFDVPVVAAVLTVIGYSLNDTIVNFDRIRENKVLMGYQASWYEVINRSVFEVLNRTLVTSLTTFVAVFILFAYGGLALRAFSITLLIGVVSGTYSSVFISNASLLKLQLSLRDV